MNISKHTQRVTAYLCGQEIKDFELEKSRGKMKDASLGRLLIRRGLQRLVELDLANKHKGRGKTERYLTNDERYLEKDGYAHQRVVVYLRGDTKERFNSEKQTFKETDSSMAKFLIALGIKAVKEDRDKANSTKRN